MKRVYLLAALFFVSLILLVTTTVCNSLIKRDLGLICSSFGKFGAYDGDRVMEGPLSIEEIDRKVVSGILTPQAKKLWTNISIAEPARKYPDFKSSAEHLLDEPWECPAMETFLTPKPEPKAAPPDETAKPYDY